MKISLPWFAYNPDKVALETARRNAVSAQLDANAANLRPHHNLEHKTRHFQFRALSRWHFYWQWRTTWQFGWLGGVYPHAYNDAGLDHDSQTQAGVVVYLGHYCFFAARWFDDDIMRLDVTV